MLLLVIARFDTHQIGQHRPPSRAFCAAYFAEHQPRHFCGVLRCTPATGMISGRSSPKEGVTAAKTGADDHAVASPQRNAVSQIIGKDRDTFADQAVFPLGMIDAKAARRAKPERAIKAVAVLDVSGGADRITRHP